jgi:SulP family sulfate permease
MRMQLGPYKFDKFEFSGSLGDIGTLIPLTVALATINGLSVSAILLMVGIFYVATGLYFKLPIPVQPLKLVAAIAIADPAKITPPVIAAAGILFGAILLIMAGTGLIDQIARWFSKPIIRGIQLGLGCILLLKGIAFILNPQLFLQHAESRYSILGMPVNSLVGIAGFFIVISLLSNRRFPAALVIVAAGIIFGIPVGAIEGLSYDWGPTAMTFGIPSLDDFLLAVVVLVIPQLPLTLSNAVIGTSDACTSFFGKGPQTQRSSIKGFTNSMGLMNIVVGLMAAMPMCHGAGGLAAHYRFGARTGGSNIIIGLLFVGLALLFGKMGVALLSSIPNAILGVLLVFAGLELALLIVDVTERADLFIALLIAGISLSTKNMGAAFVIGFITMHLMKWKKIEF